MEDLDPEITSVQIRFLWAGAPRTEYSADLSASGWKTWKIVDRHEYNMAAHPTVDAAVAHILDQHRHKPTPEEVARSGLLGSFDYGSDAEEAAGRVIAALRDAGYLPEEDT